MIRIFHGREHGITLGLVAETVCDEVTSRTTCAKHRQSTGDDLNFSKNLKAGLLVTSSSKATPSKPAQMAPLSGDKEFKYLSLCGGHFHSNQHSGVCNKCVRWKGGHHLHNEFWNKACSVVFSK